jgi:adenylosuccinate synthase
VSVSVVVGLGYGDEGKGLVTDYLCSKDPNNTKVVRFSGGHQCGHKVVRENVEHIFSNFGSGTLLGCPTYWSEYCTFEPIGFLKERRLLLKEGTAPRITIHPECPITTIYDVFVNRHSSEMKHGTTGTGFFRTKKRHYHDKIQFTVKDLVLGSERLIRQKLDSIRSYYDISEDLDLVPFFIACSSLRYLTHCGEIYISDSLIRSPHLIFEGSQGLLLDKDIGEFPHVTPSDVTPRNAMKMAKLDEIWLVTRCYQTRHGNGPMTNIGLDLRLTNTEKETNKLNKYQGEFRTSVLDTDQLLYAKIEGIDKVITPLTKVNLVMTCADQVRTYRYTRAGNLFVFSNVDRFVRLVGKKLNINGDLYVNTSPRANTIRKVS